MARDPRGFAVKFYTEDGNWDLVGNNLGVFFIRDAIKFPDFIHSQKPDPVTFEANVAERAFDFFSQTPEALHMVTLVFGPRGIPATLRHQQGFGVNTYKWVNAQGETVLVKYHWLPKQGVKSYTAADAAAIQAQDLGAHTKDLYEAIEAGDFPSWDLHVQIMSDDEHPELDFDPLDDTKVWPEETFPLRKVGTMTLNRVPENFFAESEQIAFGTGVLVDGLDFSDDKMLVGRTFSYSDTQRYRVGPNYLQLPVNQPKAKVATNQRDGQMAYGVDLAPGQNPHVNYEPSILGGLREAAYPSHDEQGPEITGRVTRKRIPRTNDYAQAGERYLLSEQWEKDDLVANLVNALQQCNREIQERMVWHFFMCEDELGQVVLGHVRGAGGHRVGQPDDGALHGVEAIPAVEQGRDGDRAVELLDQHLRVGQRAVARPQPQRGRQRGQLVAAGVHRGLDRAVEPAPGLVAGGAGGERLRYVGDLAQSGAVAVVRGRDRAVLGRFCDPAHAAEP
jgi:catalase